MNPNLDALCGPVPVRDPVEPFVPVLIQVPALTTVKRGRVYRPAGRRRRLRREVRVAGTALLFGVPMTWMALALLGDRIESPASGPATAAHVAVSGEPPLVSISLEDPMEVPSLRNRDGEAPPPVVLEEIVPDDGPEEVVHAGG